MKEGRREWLGRVDQEVSKIESPTVEHYNPKLLDIGGEHLVFEIPGRDSVVVKVNYQSLEKVLVSAHDLGVLPDKLPDDLIKVGREFIKNTEKRREELEKYFKGHIPQERDVLGNVPITPNLIREVFGDEHGIVQNDFVTGPEEATVIMRIQEKLPPEAFNEQSASFSFEYAENFPDIDEATYLAVGDLLVKDKMVEGAGELARNSLGEHMQDLLIRTFSDNELRAQVKDFVRRAIKYTNETGDILDLAGTRNAVFFKKDGEYTYLLPDAAYYHAGESMRELLVACQASGEEANGVISNCLNYVKLLNGVALLLQMPERTTLFEGIDIDMKKFLAICQAMKVK